MFWGIWGGEAWCWCKQSSNKNADAMGINNLPGCPWCDLGLGSCSLRQWPQIGCRVSGVTAVSKHPRCLLQRFTICPIFSPKDRMECMWGTDTTLIIGCYLATLLIPRVKSLSIHCQCPTHKEKQTPGTTHLPEWQGKAGSLCKTANWQSALTGTQSVLPFLTFIR